MIPDKSLRSLPRLQPSFQPIRQSALLAGIEAAIRALNSRMRATSATGSGPGSTDRRQRSKSRSRRCSGQFGERFLKLCEPRDRNDEAAQHPVPFRARIGIVVRHRRRHGERCRTEIIRHSRSVHAAESQQRPLCPRASHRRQSLRIHRLLNCRPSEAKDLLLLRCTRQQVPSLRS